MTPEYSFVWDDGYDPWDELDPTEREYREQLQLDDGEEQ